MTIVDSTSKIVRRWREGTTGDNPAGSLYAHGTHSVADMVGRTGTGSGKCGTACTGSGIFQCC